MLTKKEILEHAKKIKYGYQKELFIKAFNAKEIKVTIEELEYPDGAFVDPIRWCLMAISHRLYAEDNQRGKTRVFKDRRYHVRFDPERVELQIWYTYEGDVYVLGLQAQAYVYRQSDLKRVESDYLTAAPFRETTDIHVSDDGTPFDNVTPEQILSWTK